MRLNNMQDIALIITEVNIQSRVMFHPKPPSGFRKISMYSEVINQSPETRKKKGAI